MSEHMIDSNARRPRLGDLANRVAALFSGMATGLAIAAPATLLIGLDVALTELGLAAAAWTVATGASRLGRRHRRHARRRAPARGRTHSAQPLRIAA